MSLGPWPAEWTSSTDTYRRELVQASRAGSVPPEQIGEIVAEVERHVADTGEDPARPSGRRGTTPPASAVRAAAGPRWSARPRR